MDPARAALPALDALARGESSGDLVIRDNRLACRDGGMVSALFAGPVITDRLSMAPAEPVTLHVEKVDVPLLLAGAVAACRQRSRPPFLACGHRERSSTSPEEWQTL